MAQRRYESGIGTGGKSLILFRFLEPAAVQSGETAGVAALERHLIAGNRLGGIAYLLPSHLQ
jgi:hypothetical protein